jgi:MoaA/NifB/PqqE/SkfB family radical SAM enzyme
MDQSIRRDTFCVYPFLQLIVRQDGGAQVCNWTPRRVRANGSTMSVNRDSLAEIWNSTELGQMRDDMLNGRRVAACRNCYELEDGGALSPRQRANEAWQEGFINETGQTMSSLIAQLERASRVEAEPPRFLQLDVGNLCNLACRTCNPGASSRVAADPVHASWTGGSASAKEPGHQWFTSRPAIEAIIAGCRNLRQLHILGGEPFLIKEIRDVLDVLVQAGLAAGIELSMHTNGTRVRSPWLDKAAAFERLVLYVSLDGAGAVYEYIRWPAKWSRVTRNIAHLLTLPNVDVRANVVFQAYNALNVTDLLRYLDKIGVAHSIQVLDWPNYLRARSLPEEARRLCADRLERYALEAPAHSREPALSIAHQMREHRHEVRPSVRAALRRFTAELDESRNQSLAAADPELADILASGNPSRPDPRGWRDAHPPVAPQVPQLAGETVVDVAMRPRAAQACREIGGGFVGHRPRAADRPTRLNRPPGAR